MDSNTHDHAVEFVRSGCSVIPLKLDGTKAPDIDRWGQYQIKPPTAAELSQWFDNNEPAGIGLLMGAGNLWALDIDAPELCDPFCDNLNRIWPEFTNHIAVIDTPRPGRQLIVKLEGDVPGNDVFAQRDVDGEIKATIESRGLGGYCVGLGSPVSVHATQKPYVQAAGPRISGLQPISQLQFEKLCNLARSFNEVVLQQSGYTGGESAYVGEPRPGEVFNKHADWQQLLTDNGWQLDHEHGDIRYLVRPGKQPGDGHSATLGSLSDDNGPLLVVYTSALPYGPAPGKTARVLTRFDFSAAAYHKGSYGDAAVAARVQYGKELADAQATYWASQTSDSPKPTHKSLCLADIEPENVYWLWQNFIAQNVINQFSAVQGFGKGHCIMDIASRLTRGADWPDGSKNPLGPSSVLMLAAEDDPATVIKPRMMTSNADMNLVHVVPPCHEDDQGRIVNFTLMDGFKQLADELSLFDHMGKPPCRLIIIDPVTSFMGKADQNSSGETRDAMLTPLTYFAQKHQVSILLINHFSKDSKRGVVDRSLGSTAFVAVARLYLAGLRDPNDPERRILFRAKCNIAPDGQAMAYKIQAGVGNLSQSIRVNWEPEPFDFDPEDAKPKTSREDKRDQLKKWLDLQQYPQPVRDIYNEAHEIFGASDKLVRDVAGAVNIYSDKIGFEGPWMFIRRQETGEPKSDVSTGTSDFEDGPKPAPSPRGKKPSDLGDLGESCSDGGASGPVEGTSQTTSNSPKSAKSEVNVPLGDGDRLRPSSKSEVPVETSDFVLGDDLDADDSDFDWED